MARTGPRATLRFVAYNYTAFSEPIVAIVLKLKSVNIEQGKIQDKINTQHVGRLSYAVLNNALHARWTGKVRARSTTAAGRAV